MKIEKHVDKYTGKSYTCVSQLTDEDKKCLRDKAEKKLRQKAKSKAIMNEYLDSIRAR